MTAPTRPARTSPPRLPTIPRRTTEEAEREQVQYLLWRGKLFLKDAGASKERQKRFHERISTSIRQGQPYEVLCRIIEEEMLGFLAKQADNIQSIFNEK